MFAMMMRMQLFFAVLRRRSALIGSVLAITAIVSGVYLWKDSGSAAASLAAAAGSYQTPQEQSDVYVRFEMEAYDRIAENFWVKPGSYGQFGVPELPDLFRLAADQQMGATFALASSTRGATAEMLAQVFATASSTDAKRQDALAILSLILQALPPQGHDQLLSSQAQTALKNTVENVNPSVDLYGNLGLPTGASAQEVEQAYAKKKQELAATTSAQGKQALAQAQQAQAVLSSPVNKAIYDETGAQPTVSTHRDGDTLYIGIGEVAPTTIQEFIAAIEDASTTPGLDSLIIDLRGNVGGSLDFTQNFMSLFLGANQYAFDLYHQGDLDVQRTPASPKMPELARYREIAVLVDGMTQSTAELTASVLQHDHFAYVVGEKSRGWGSVETTYPLSTSIDSGGQYALLLVTYLTVRGDGNPIEGNGVIPDVDVSQVGWQAKLPQYFFSPSVISALKKEAAPSSVAK